MSKKLMKKTESPIEVILAEKLIQHASEYNVKINAQKKIKANESMYRVDFLLTDLDNGKQLIVECDGHKFHAMSKKQVIKDNKRTRSLYNLGYDLIRFSGSEIFRDADKCAFEAVSLLVNRRNQPKENHNWILQKREIISNNITLLENSDLLQKQYPNLFKIIKRYIPELITINREMATMLHGDFLTDSEGNPLIRYSLSQWLEKMKIKKSDNLNRILVLFVLLYLLNKPKDSEIPEHLLLDAKQYAKKKGFNKHTNFYSIPSYSNNVLEKSEEMALILKESGLQLSAFGRESIERTFGKDVADRMYPQMKDYKFSQMSEDFRNECEKVIFELLVENNGYCTKEQILDKISFDPDKYKHKIATTNEKLLNKMLPEIMSKYALTIVKSSKVVNEKYSITGRNRNLIVRKEE